MPRDAPLSGAHPRTQGIDRRRATIISIDGGAAVVQDRSFEGANMTSDTEPVRRSPEPPVVRQRTARPVPLVEDGTLEGLERPWPDASPGWERWFLVALAAATVAWLGWPG